MHIELSVSGQRLRREMGPGIVGGSRYYLTAHVAFAGTDWDGAQVWLRIDQDGAQNAYLRDADGCVTAERGINLPAGQYTMSLLGLRDNMRITTNVVPLCVLQSGADGGDPLPEVPQTAAEQIALLAQEAADTARSVREDADAGLFDGEDGKPGKDGESATHQWDGSVLTITSASGTSSADLRGPQGPEGKQGPQGQAGKDAPQDAVRYGVQELDEAQQAQARGNIGAASAEELGRLKGDIDSNPQFGDPYEGVDLTIKHATEIADYASPWAWIKARIAAGNFSQLHVGDYIPFTTTNGRTFQAKIAGINTYKGYGDSEVGNHIDFITRELWPDTFQMNSANFNNGTSSDKKVPWLASNGYLFVNSLAGQVPNGTTLPLDMVDKDYTAGGMYFYLPDDLKAVIVEKRVWAQTRYSASGVLTNDNSGAWVNLGKLWLPDEYEVTGARLMTTTGWFSGGYVQYPIFAGNMNRLKRANGSRNNWWLSSAGAGGSTAFVRVGIGGQVSSDSASSANGAPFCFRI